MITFVRLLEEVALYMPGATGHRWQWIGKPPLYWTVIAYAIMGNVAAGLALSFSLPRWAPSIPDASHPIELRKGGHPFFLSRGMGWYLDNDIWITFALLAILVFIMFILFIATR
jgi:hypothetical protein